MPRLEAKEGQLTIPVTDDVREKLDLHAGDELSSHVIEGSVIYTLSTPDARERAWRRIDTITSQVRPSPRQARKPITKVEQEIVEEVKRARRSRCRSR